MRATSVGLALIFLVWSMSSFSCASPPGSSKVPEVREYSAELVLPSSARPEPFGSRDFDCHDNIVKVFASQGRIRLDIDQGRLVVLFDSSTNEGRLLLNRDREFIRLPPEGGNLVAFPRLAFWTVVALRFTPPPSDQPRNICAVLEKSCRKVGEETIVGRAAEKWEACKSIEYGGRIGIPVQNADSPDRKMEIKADYICFIELLPFLDPSRFFTGPAYIWIDKKLGIPIKREIVFERGEAGGRDFELRNIVQARQDPSLFSFPEGYAERR